MRRDMDWIIFQEDYVTSKQLYELLNMRAVCPNLGLNSFGELILCAIDRDKYEDEVGCSFIWGAPTKCLVYQFTKTDR